jgi:cyclic pyranopterin phosphate synthase
VRFIEMMPIGYGREFPFQDEESIKAVLEEAYGPMTPADGCFGNGPCHYYTIDGFLGKIGFISAITHKFCDKCNRVRLTADGMLKGCLQFQSGADLREILRDGSTEEQLTHAIEQVIWNKPVSHNFYEMHTKQDETRAMSQIGG